MGKTTFKLEEAKYFFNQMKNNIKNRQALEYNLSAFLSSARSILYFMEKEFKNENWFANITNKFNSYLKKDVNFKYFKEKRNLTIHEKPVIPAVELSAEDTIKITDNMTIDVVDKNGNIIAKLTPTSKPDDKGLIKTKDEKNQQPQVFWIFDDRPDEDLFELCNQYLIKLEELVIDCEKQYSKSRSKP